MGSLVQLLHREEATGEVPVLCEHATCTTHRASFEDLEASVCGGGPECACCREHDAEPAPGHHPPREPAETV